VGISCGKFCQGKVFYLMKIDIVDEEQREGGKGALTPFFPIFCPNLINIFQNKKYLKKNKYFSSKLKKILL
jgi:hypothetical protein